MIFFGGLTRYALGRHMGDDAARRLAVPVGLVLTVGLLLLRVRLAMLEGLLGISAVLLIALVLATVVWRVLRLAGAPPIVTLLILSFLILLVVESVSPNLLRTQPALHALASFLLLGLCAVLFLSAIGHLSHGSIGHLPGSRGSQARAYRVVDSLARRGFVDAKRLVHHQNGWSGNWPGCPGFSRATCRTRSSKP